MIKEELINYLKDNLKIKVTTRNSRIATCGVKYLKVIISLEDIIISSSETYL